jgi:hypothetical protein
MEAVDKSVGRCRKPVGNLLEEVLAVVRTTAKDVQEKRLTF